VESVKRVMSKFYSRKVNIKTVRVDWPTQLLIEEMAQTLGLSESEIIRASVWITSILLDKSVSLRQVLKQEAVEKLASGGDTPVVDALAIDHLLETKLRTQLRDES